MVKTNYVVALSNYHCVIIRQHFENIHSFMYKYKIYDYEWYGPINGIFKNINNYVLSCLDEDVQCDTIAIRELCESSSIVASCTSSLKHYALNNFKYIFFMSS